MQKMHKHTGYPIVLKGRAKAAVPLACVDVRQFAGRSGCCKKTAAQRLCKDTTGKRTQSALISLDASGA